MTDEAALYLVETRVELPLRPPSDDQMTALMDLGGMTLPFSRLPWVERGDYVLEIDFDIVNLDDATHEVDFVVNGFNEFHEYVPLFILDEDDIIPEFAQWERRYEIEPFGHHSGTVRHEELDEVAIDLATVVNGVPNPHSVVYFDSQSAHDPRWTSYIPAVIPALTGVRVGLRTFETSNLVAELTVRIRDDRRIVAKDLDDAWMLPVPELFLPSSVFMFMP
jgi:hypothetical protein